MHLIKYHESIESFQQGLTRIQIVNKRNSRSIIKLLIFWKWTLIFIFLLFFINHFRLFVFAFILLALLYHINLLCCLCLDWNCNKDCRKILLTLFCFSQQISSEINQRHAKEHYFLLFLKIMIYNNKLFA